MNNVINKAPKANCIYPMPNLKRVAYLKPIITNPQIEVGDYTYYDDPESVHNFEKNVLYLFDHVGDKLIIGKFCQIASGVRFIMNGGNHNMHGFTTYPFEITGFKLPGDYPTQNSKGNTIVGNDVWLGNSVTVMPGITIGDGAIVGTNALVTRNVEPYTIVGGNPARKIRDRFDDETKALLLQLQWWNWNTKKIIENISTLDSGDLVKLKMLADA